MKTKEDLKRGQNKAVHKISEEDWKLVEARLETMPDDFERLFIGSDIPMTIEYEKEKVIVKASSREEYLKNFKKTKEEINKEEE